MPNLQRTPFPTLPAHAPESKTLPWPVPPQSTGPDGIAAGGRRVPHAAFVCVPLDKDGETTISQQGRKLKATSGPSLGPLWPSDSFCVGITTKAFLKISNNGKFQIKTFFMFNTYLFE